MEIIVLSINKYKENDAIITGLSNDGIITFLGKSIFKSNNKNKWISTPFSIADVNFIDGKYKYPIMKDCSVIFSPLSLNSGLEEMSFYMNLSDATNKIIADEEKHLLFPVLKQCLIFAKDNKKYIELSLFYILKALEISGYQFNVQKCVHCSLTNNLNHFSFYAGGLICDKCANKTDNYEILSASKKDIIVDFISNKTLDFIKNNTYINTEVLSILNSLNLFVKDNCGFSIKSLQLLNN